MKFKLSEMFRWVCTTDENGNISMNLQSCVFENGKRIWENIPIVDSEDEDDV